MFFASYIKTAGPRLWRIKKLSFYILLRKKLYFQGDTAQRITEGAAFTPLIKEGWPILTHKTQAQSVDCLLILEIAVDKGIYPTLIEILFSYSTQVMRKKQQNSQPIITDKAVDEPWDLKQQTFTYWMLQVTVCKRKKKESWKQDWWAAAANSLGSAPHQ